MQKNKNLTKTVSSTIERKFLIFFMLIFIGLTASAWIYAMKLRQSVVANNAVANVDPRALIEIERLRNTAESQIANGRSFFLLGSRTLYDNQKKDKQTLLDSLAAFDKQYHLAGVSEIVKRIEAVEQQHQDIFDQAMQFREKQTESKIVGQFYQSKTASIRNKINDALDEIVRLHNTELERARSQAHQAARDVEVQIPQGMVWFTGSMAILFLCVSLLVLRMLSIRSRQLAERDRLYNEAQKANQGRDEIISAISQDLKEPLNALNELADSLPNLTEATQLKDASESLKTSVLGIDDLVKDICDQAKADEGNLTLRLDQLSIDDLLDDARIMLQPLAKQKDIRLQFDSVNPPVLAFFEKDRILRVLSNLVNNAVKFSPKHSRVIIKVRSDQQFVNISVTDSGPGIPENQMAEIFANFWQARKTADQGAGVGLAIVKTIIEAHGGSVRVDSRSGNGSTFTFSLPRRRPVGAHIKKTAPTVRHSPKKDYTEFFEGPAQ